MITNEEKIILINNRLDILNLDADIIQKEIDFYTEMNIEEKMAHASNKLNQIPLKIQAIEQELNRLTA
jgi:hypothetical protein